MSSPVVLRRSIVLNEEGDACWFETRIDWTDWKRLVRAY
jgi:hypothetical protein